MSEPTITNVAARQQYEISVDGLRAGWAAYLDIGDTHTQRIFHHTEIDDPVTPQAQAAVAAQQD